MKKFEKGDKIKIIKWYFDNRLPIPSYGVVRSVSEESYSITLDVPFKGMNCWGFKIDEVVPDDRDQYNISTFKNELLEIINSDKPAEHILLDVKDYLTN